MSREADRITAIETKLDNLAKAFVAASAVSSMPLDAKKALADCARALGVSP